MRWQQLNYHRMLELATQTTTRTVGLVELGRPVGMYRGALWHPKDARMHTTTTVLLANNSTNKLCFFLSRFYYFISHQTTRHYQTQAAGRKC